MSRNTHSTSCVFRLASCVLRLASCGLRLLRLRFHHRQFIERLLYHHRQSPHFNTAYPPQPHQCSCSMLINKGKIAPPTSSATCCHRIGTPGKNHVQSIVKRTGEKIRGGRRYRDKETKIAKRIEKCQLECCTFASDDKREYKTPRPVLSVTWLLDVLHLGEHVTGRDI